MSRYLVGIDLGTTNIAVAYVDTASKAAGGPRLHTFKVPQVVAAGQVQDLDLLPSFLYIPGPHDLSPGAIDLPWKKNPPDTVGMFARNHGAKVPGRQVSSAKSWLCHPGVDRTAPLLPWAGPPDVPRLSPLEVSARYLKHIVDAWNAVPGRKPADHLEEQTVVVTVPASFDDVARNLTADAAKQAGLKHVTLLEEPQAAFYAWLGTHSPQEAGMLKPGMRCLVVDVGGGTSDFSLIRAGEEKGELTFIRDAVGDHLLLGGDNMDLALAKAVELKLPGGRLDAAQFGALVQACRGAKEALLASPPPPTYPVTVMGKGRSVVGGTVSVNIKPEDVANALFEGFFPMTPFDADPAKGVRTGLQEMGLPYVTDAAVSKHLAAFIRQHVPANEAVDAILFNGGVFQPEVLRQRVIDVMRPWFDAPKKGWEPLVLTSPSLDLAVAWGAAYFAWLKHSGGRRIGGGIPRSYYVAIETDTPGRGIHAHSIPVLCVVPRRMQEGEEVHMPSPVLELALGEPVLFPLYTSTVRGDDKPGQVLRLPEESLMRLPPLHTILRGGKRAGAKRVPVTLAAKCTEIGTLELYCESKEGNRWRLEFNVRDVLREPSEDDEEAEAKEAVIDVFPEEKVQAAGALIAQVFGDVANPDREVGGATEKGATDKVGGGTPSSSPPRTFRKLLDTALESSRSDWPTGLCRRLWDFLEANAAGRGKSPGHLSRWYNLTGFEACPGFGDPVDRYRVEALWKLITTGASQASRDEEARLRCPKGVRTTGSCMPRQRWIERRASAAVVHLLETGTSAGEGEAVLAPAGQRVRGDVARRREPGAARRQDEGVARRGGGPRLQEGTGADLCVLGADAARLPRATVRSAQFGRSPGDRRAVDRRTVAVSAEQRQRAERLAVLPVATGPPQWVARRGRERPNALPCSGGAADQPVPRRVAPRGGRGRRPGGRGTVADVR